MAIVQVKDGDFWRTYSDAGVRIHGGFPEGDYDEAYDDVQREYVETEIPRDDDQSPDAYYAEAGRILLGEEVE